MGINKSLKSEASILLNARKGVVVTFIIFVICLFGSEFLYRIVGYKIINNTDYNTIFVFLPLTIHAIFCGWLYNVMSRNIILSLIIGVLMIVLS